MAEIKFLKNKPSSSIIKVIGVGGAGCNAVNHMYNAGIYGVDFIICNTDAQVLQNSPVSTKIQLGEALTEGRGAGNQPEKGELAAIESLEDIRGLLKGTKMLFITAGMGGGTGTGAAPVIAGLAFDMKILTIAVVTVPSRSEGSRRYNQALEGVKKMEGLVDSLLVIDNKKLYEIYGNLPASQAFKKADDIIGTAVKGVVEIITLPGIINIDFADVHTVLHKSEVFIMGTGTAEGKGRAMDAVLEALESPLLDRNDIIGCKDILLNITSGDDEVTVSEIGEINDYLQKIAGDDANIIWGNGRDLQLGNKINVTIIATRFDKNPSFIIQPEQFRAKPIADTVVEPVECNLPLEMVMETNLPLEDRKKKRKRVKAKSGGWFGQLKIFDFFDDKNDDMNNKY